MRQFPYITVGKILEELWEEKNANGSSEEELWTINVKGEKVKRYPINRITFIRLEKRLNLPQIRRTTGKHHWRVYTREQADLVKNKIKEEYNMFSET